MIPSEPILYAVERYSEEEKSKMCVHEEKFLVLSLCDRIRLGLTLIGGRPGMGCTTLAVAMAMETALEGDKVLYYAHPQHRVAEKVLSFLRHKSKKKGGYLTFASEKEMAELEKIPLYHLPLIFSMTLDEIKSSIVAEVEKLRPKFIFIDSAEDVIVSNYQSRFSDEEYICRELRDLSLQVNVPIILTAYLGRGPEERSGVWGKEPQLGDFRGGDLAIFANHVFDPYRPEYYHIYNDEKTGEDIRGRMYVHILKDTRYSNATEIFL